MNKSFCNKRWQVSSALVFLISCLWAGLILNEVHAAPEKDAGPQAITLPAECNAPEARDFFNGLVSELTTQCEPKVQHESAQLVLALYKDWQPESGSEFWRSLQETTASLLEEGTPAPEARGFAYCMADGAIKRLGADSASGSAITDSLNEAFQKQTATVITEEDKALFAKLSQNYSTPAGKSSAQPVSIHVRSLLTQTEQALVACDVGIAEKLLSEIQNEGPICDPNALGSYYQSKKRLEDIGSTNAKLEQVVTQAQEVQAEAIAACKIAEAQAAVAEVGFDSCSLRQTPVETLRLLKRLREEPISIQRLMSSIENTSKEVENSIVSSCETNNAAILISRIERDMTALQQVAPACVDQSISPQAFAQLKQRASETRRGSASPRLKQQLELTQNEANRLKERAQDKWLTNSELKADIVRLRRNAREIEERAGACDPTVAANVTRVMATIDSIPIPGERGDVASPRTVAEVQRKKESSFFGKLFGSSTEATPEGRGRLTR